MSKGFSYKIRQRAIRKAVHYNRRDVAFPGLNTIKTIGLVVPECFTDEKILKQLSLNAEVQWLRFVSTKSDKNGTKETIFIDDLNFWGLPKQVKINKFIQQPFDLLVNFSSDTNDAIEFVCAKSVAKFKVRSKSNGLIYDLVIGGITDNYLLIEEIKKTLNNFNKRA